MERRPGFLVFGSYARTTEKMGGVRWRLFRWKQFRRSHWFCRLVAIREQRRRQQIFSEGYSIFFFSFFFHFFAMLHNTYAILQNLTNFCDITKIWAILSFCSLYMYDALQGKFLNFKNKGSIFLVILSKPHLRENKYFHWLKLTRLHIFIRRPGCATLLFAMGFLSFLFLHYANLIWKKDSYIIKIVTS